MKRLLSILSFLVALLVLARGQASAQTPTADLPPAEAIAVPSEQLMIASPPTEPPVAESDSLLTAILGRWSPDVLLAPLEQLPLTINGFAAVDSWRGPSDGHFQNNNGFKKGLNVGGLLPVLGEYGIGAQLGASYGLYDSTGRASAANAGNEIQQQTFITGGFFRRATPELPLAGGVVYDGMINDSFGVFAQSPYLSQFRLQLGYLITPGDELGFWMTQHGPGNTHYPDGIATSFRGVNQYNLFWHHHYQRSSGDTWSWIGVPNHHRLDGDGSLGQLILGSAGSVPLSERTTMYAVANYMMPSSRPSAEGSTQDSFYVGFGVSHFIGPKARHATAAGNAGEAYLPVADNATFFVDTTRTL